jgi:hypothetical protein
MSEERTTIADIIKVWFKDCSVVRIGEKGTPYSIIPSSKMPESLKILAKTMHEAGYSYKEMDDFKVSLKIADTCWREDKIVKMSSADVKKSKYSLTLDWDLAIATYCNVKIAKLEENEKIVETFKRESNLELNPSDRIKMDTSDQTKPEWDEEILAEFATIGVTIDKGENE